ncbi:putative glucuronate isomerase (uronic isomerase) protein (plasmid) [Sinorhizobium meliloti SM11]|uniref:Uronate isomerase n=1 Tax=Sinorhizobium meliloti (strain SM11) TaxID=707241 RepID=F7XG24_SINMM|nr:glucuronate isomerase [Sinorhizobium meliloti]AEH83500.1 putative glucuronate isomerase (uronic isomerase) protein [Sinorhizobium meliloti SM11]MDE4561023.1 glucuronate isomerase [Sinorhizobium meliloti SM11]
MRGLIDPDLLFPAEERTRALARRLYAEVSGLPIVSPHGHTEPRWYALDEAFPDPAQLLIVPDHYVFRMLFSQGIRLEELGVPALDGSPVETDGRAIWRRFCENYHLFRGTPTRLWFDYTLSELFGIDELPSAASSDRLYDHVAECLTRPDYRPRALYERFNIEVISTTDSALDDLGWHAKILESGWKGRVVPAYRPDAVVDPDFQGFPTNLDKLGDITGADTGTWSGYLDAHRTRRAYFKDFGATSTDHGHATADTANLPQAEAAALFDKVRLGKANADERRLFPAQMLTEMAKMSLDDGLVMQIHPGSFRNHSPAILAKFGRDKGFDIPTRTDYVTALKPLLDAVGLERDLTVILFTLDETSYARELAPLAGVYPALKLGPAWWFHDSAEGMRRFREMTTETAGFYNTVGFNDDTRAFPSIPARHNIARRVDCAFLARLVAEHRLREDEAYELARDLAYGLAKEAYRL